MRYFNFYPQLFILLLCFVALACGHHETQTSVSRPSDVIRAQVIASTPEEILIKAIDTDDRKTLEKVLADGFAINELMKNGKAPLHHAIFVDKPRSVKILMSKGADPNVKDNTDKDAFKYAAESSNPQKMELLLKPEKMLELQQKLFKAVQQKRFALVEKALEDGVDPNFLDTSGETPLTQATINQKVVVLEVLLKFMPTVVDPHFPNKNGLTALQIAEQSNWSEGAELIRPKTITSLKN